jgi:3-oxoacyl-[acyl-carrier protein] reductase
MDLGLRGHVFLLTGATSGLGYATARTLVAEGAHVVVSGRTPERVEAAVARLGDSARGVIGDNAEAALPIEMLEVADAAWGRVDGALISVGGPPAGGVLEASDEQWRDAFESVFLGAVRTARVVSDHLGYGGSIAFVLSTSVKAPLPGLGVSNGLRPGLAMAAKTMADELGPRGIRVNGLLPGRIATDRTTALDAAGGDPEGAREASIKHIPLGRYGDPEEFGRVATFLLSPAASFVTGAMIPVDGGATRSL